MNGWIKFYRKIWQSKHFDYKNKANMILVFIWWLSHCDEDGRCTYGLRQIAEDTGISKSSVKRAVDNLAFDIRSPLRIEPKQQPKQLYSTVLISNWADYQDKPKQQPSSNRNATATEAGHNKKKEDKKKERIYKKENYSSLEDLTDIVCQEVATDKSISLSDAKRVREGIKLYCEGHGKSYKNYKAVLVSWILNDIQKGKISIVRKTEAPVFTIPPEQREINRKVVEGLSKDIGRTPWDMPTMTG